MGKGGVVTSAPAVIVDRLSGEAVRLFLASIGALDFNLKIKVENKKIFLPLARELTKFEEEQLKEKFKCKIEIVNFEEKPRKPRSILEWLRDKLPPYLLASVPNSWDAVGDVVIVELPPELAEHEKLIAEAILAVHKNIRSVYAKTGAVGGTFRVRPLKLIGGEDKSVTVHREHGAMLVVDVKNVYFSPRLATERKRVAEQVLDGEVVVDLFSGVGPFAIQIALRKKALVYAIELNPIAYECLVKNVKLNNLKGKVVTFLGDAREVVENNVVRTADRVIMNLPERAVDYIDVALKALRGRGILHLYLFEREEDYEARVKEKVLRKVEENGWKVVDIPYVGLVKQVAPRQWHVAVDVEVQANL
ncbi:MAG: class I SAM-dependent methyltransferase family protein [Candidatus Nezhaarchaeota archaeon]|nr:class I SAM-dependent methyltransferase family protein [Candidatus Nezhaarchaeota archaeon]